MNDSISSTITLKQAYQYCMSLAKNHYENFPVASKLLKKDIRQAISVIYAFARSADDFADEGDLSSEQRLLLLNDYIKELDLINNQSQFTSNNPIFIALSDVIKQHHLPIQLFYDLLQAFKQDVIVTRYETMEDILNYCHLSANPVGRLLLHLHNQASEENCRYSDAICSGLQLINFYQDIAQDINENNRLYLPLDQLAQYEVTIETIEQQQNTQQTQQLLNALIADAQALFESGKPLYKALSGRFSWEIRLIYHAGHLILEKLSAQTNNIYSRPRISHSDKIRILYRALLD